MTEPMVIQNIRRKRVTDGASKK